MFRCIAVLCAVAAVSNAGLVPTNVHYSPAEAVSSQSIVRHDQRQVLATKYVAPVAKLAVSAPVAYHAAPAAVTYHAAPAPAVYRAAPAAVTYHAAPTPAVYHAAHAAVTYAAPAPIAHYATPVAKVLSHHEEEVAYPKYEYSYSVADGHTGDNKSQQETRDGDVVKGSYSFQEADGSIRTVEYSADDHNGFNAVVHNSAPKAAPALIKSPVYAAPAPALYYKH